MSPASVQVHPTAFLGRVTELAAQLVVWSTASLVLGPCRSAVVDIGRVEMASSVRPVACRYGLLEALASSVDVVVVVEGLQRSTRRSCLTTSIKSIGMELEGREWKRLSESSSFSLAPLCRLRAITKTVYPSDNRLWRETLSHGNSDPPVCCYSSQLDELSALCGIVSTPVNERSPFLRPYLQLPLSLTVRQCRSSSHPCCRQCTCTA